MGTIINFKRAKYRLMGRRMMNKVHSMNYAMIIAALLSLFMIGILDYYTKRVENHYFDIQQHEVQMTTGYQLIKSDAH